MEKKGGFSDKLRLKETAEEDIYFARRDRERIEALHEEKSAEQLRGEEARHSIEKQAQHSMTVGRPRTLRSVIEWCSWRIPISSCHWQLNQTATMLLPPVVTDSNDLFIA